LIINESGLFRLILKSRKPVAQQLRENIIKVLPKIRKHGLNWASLPETWGKDSLVWSEWVAKKEKNYFRRHPDASHEDFIMSLPNR
jgi:prophage antirepressor-like protein